MPAASAKRDGSGLAIANASTPTASANQPRRCWTNNCSSVERIAHQPCQGCGSHRWAIAAGSIAKCRSASASAPATSAGATSRTRVRSSTMSADSTDPPGLLRLLLAAAYLA